MILAARIVLIAPLSKPRASGDDPIIYEIVESLGSKPRASGDDPPTLLELLNSVK